MVCHQILFSYLGGTSYRNAIRSRHHNSNDFQNGIDFYTWDAGTNGVQEDPTLHGMPVAGGRVGVSELYPETFLHINHTGALNGTSDGTSIGSGSILRLQR